MQRLLGFNNESERSYECANVVRGVASAKALIPALVIALFFVVGASAQVQRDVPCVPVGCVDLNGRASCQFSSGGGACSCELKPPTCYTCGTCGPDRTCSSPSCLNALPRIATLLKDDQLEGLPRAAGAQPHPKPRPWALDTELAAQLHAFSPAMSQIVADFQGIVRNSKCGAYGQGMTILVPGDEHTEVDWKFYSLADGGDRIETNQGETLILTPERWYLSSKDRQIADGKIGANAKQ